MSLADARSPLGMQERQRLFGVYPALVVDVADPLNQGRVRVELP